MSHRRRKGKPVRQVELRVTVEAERAVLKKIATPMKVSAIPGDALAFTIRGRNPALVAKKARRLAKIVRTAAEAGK